MAIDDILPWQTVLDERKEADVEIPGRAHLSIAPFITSQVKGSELFRILAINFGARGTWWLAGSIIQKIGQPGQLSGMALKRAEIQLNRWTIFEAERIEENFFLAFEPAHWHQQMDLIIQRFDPSGGGGGGGDSSSRAITVRKNVLVNPSFEIWNQTGSDTFTPTGIQRITIAPGWEIRTWTDEGTDFGIVSTSRKLQNDSSLPFTTYLQWKQVTPKESGGGLYLVNRVNEQALNPGDVIVFHGYVRIAGASGFLLPVILEGGGHPWTSLGRIAANISWSPFAITYQLSNSLRPNLYGLILQFLMPSNRSFELEVGGMQLEVNGAPTDLELYFPQ